MDIIFMGDSLIAYYDWQQRFPGHSCVNLGVPGETVAGCLGQLSQAVRRYAQADMVVLMIGTNNLVMSDYSLLAPYEQLLQELHQAYPQADIVACSLLPLQLPWLAPDTHKRLNELIKGLAKPEWGVYLDICHAFEQDDTAACFVEDGVHLSAEGYRRWASVLAKLLDRTS